MPNKKSAKKDLRKNIKKRAINRRLSTDLKAQLKADNKKIKNNDSSVKDTLSATIKKIDKAAQKGLIKKNAANRKKSRLMRKVNNLK